MELDRKIKEHEDQSGMLIVFSGPSGVGKDTLLIHLQEVCPSVERCVTYTTRKPRKGETPGVDYFFVSEKKFHEMIGDGEFLEYAKVHLDYYGTPMSCVPQTLKEGADIVLKIDIQGGLIVKNKIRDAVMIFVVPPSMDELERRLRSRYTDSEEAIQKRLENARSEIACVPQYDYLVVNDDIDSAVDKLRCIITAERARIR